jgi:hypothetical protein
MMFAVPSTRRSARPSKSGAALASQRHVLVLLSTYRLTSPYGMHQTMDPTLEGVNLITDNPWIPTRGGPRETASARLTG